MTETIKKCADCKFSDPYNDRNADKWVFAKCRHPDSRKEDEEKWHLGETGTAHHYCSTMRHDACGKAATLFEPREPK